MVFKTNHIVWTMKIHKVLVTIYILGPDSSISQIGIFWHSALLLAASLLARSGSPLNWTLEACWLESRGTN